jgi:hypothetical protein
MLADVRALLERHLPADRRARSTWRHVADQLAKAAGGAMDPAHVSIALRMVLAIEGIECRQPRANTPATRQRDRRR